MLWRTDYIKTVAKHGTMTTRVKLAMATSARSKLTCATQCLQQVACRHVHSTTSTCYLLGSDALIGQDTAHTLQPSDLIYTRDLAGTCSMQVQGVYQLEDHNSF